MEDKRTMKKMKEGKGGAGGEGVGGFEIVDTEKKNE